MLKKISISTLIGLLSLLVGFCNSVETQALFNTQLNNCQLWLEGALYDLAWLNDHATYPSPDGVGLVYQTFYSPM